MVNLTFKILFLIFSLYCLIYSCSYGIHEIKAEKNTYGGTIVIICTISSILFTNIVIWQK